jgi:hypothetical protein
MTFIQRRRLDPGRRHHTGDLWPRVRRAPRCGGLPSDLQDSYQQWDVDGCTPVATPWIWVKAFQGNGWKLYCPGPAPYNWASLPIGAMWYSNGEGPTGKPVPCCGVVAAQARGVRPSKGPRLRRVESPGGYEETREFDLRRNGTRRYSVGCKPGATASPSW